MKSFLEFHCKKFPFFRNNKSVWESELAGLSISDVELCTAVDGDDDDRRLLTQGKTRQS